MTQHFIRLLGLVLLALSTLNCGGGKESDSSASATAPAISAINVSGALAANSMVTLAGVATDPGNLALTYSWDFGDGGAKDTGTTVYRIYTSASTYTATLTVTNTAGLSSSKTTALSIGPGNAASANVTPACQDGTCGGAFTTAGTTTTYTGSGTGVLGFANLTSAPITRNINLQGAALAGKTVTLVFSNGQSTKAAAAPGTGTLASPVLASANPLTSPNSAAIQGDGHEDHEHHQMAVAHSQMLSLNRQVAQEMKALSASQSAHSPSSYSPNAAPVISPPNIQPAVAVGDTKSWYEDYTKKSEDTTARRTCPIASTGRNVVFWVQNTIYTAGAASALGTVTDANLDAYQKQFCETDNLKHGYPTISSVLGDVWGAVPPAYSRVTIADKVSAKQDINIVILDPGAAQGWGGYFYSLNNFLKTASAKTANSNQALVFFINARQIQAYINSVLIHELTHMINFYQRTILHDDSHETWLEETSAMMTEDIFDSGATLDRCSSLTPIACRLDGYARTGGAVSYFDWANLSASSYDMGGSFGAFLNRRFGPRIYAQLMTDCYTPSTKKSSVDCLDFLIQNNGGPGFTDEFARFGASVFGKINEANPPAQYGFPTKIGTLPPTGNMASNYVYSLPKLTINSASAPTVATALSTFTGTTQTYKIDSVASGKTSYVRTNVTVPGKTTLLMTVK